VNPVVEGRIIHNPLTELSRRAGMQSEIDWHGYKPITGKNRGERLYEEVRLLEERGRYAPTAWKRRAIDISEYCLLVERTT